MGSALFVKLWALAGTSLTGFLAFFMGKIWLLTTLLKPFQAIIYVFMQAKVKNFMRQKKKLDQEIFDAELDVEDLSLPPTVDVFRTKHGIITQRNKKIRKLNNDIQDLWALLKKYNVAFGGDDGARLMYEVETARRAMQDALRAYPKLLMEMRALDNHYNREEIEIEDRLNDALMEKARKFSFVGKWLRVALYVVGWWFVVDWFFNFTYDIVDADSNINAYLEGLYAEQALYYHDNIQTPVKWFCMIVGGGFLFLKRLFPGEDIYVEFTRRLLVALRGLSILAMGGLFVYAAMHWVLPLLLKDGIIYEVFLKDYPAIASILTNTLFGLIVLVGWIYLTFKSAKKLFWDPRKIKTSEADNFRAEEFYDNQKIICKQYTLCAESYYTLVILIEYTRERKENAFEDFSDLEFLTSQSKNENAFFDDLQAQIKLTELDKVLPSRYDYKVKKQETQQDV